MPSNKKPFIAYTHIEKCAGTTMNFILGNNFPLIVYPKPIGFTNDERTAFKEEYLQRLMKKLPFIQGVSGHNVRPFTKYENVVKGDVFRFTILREPVSRYLSHLNYQRTDMGIDHSIESYLESKRDNNFQVNKIAGTNSADDAIKIADELLQFVGIMEYFDQSIILLDHLLPIQLNAYFMKRNVLKDKKEVQHKPYKWNDFTPAQQAKVQENNAEDIKLYNHCLEQFKNSYQQATGKPLDQLKQTHTNETKSMFYCSILFKRLYRKVIEKGMVKDYLATQE